MDCIQDWIGELQETYEQLKLIWEDKNRFLKRVSYFQNEMDLDFSCNNDPLENLPKQKREIYKEVFGLVYDCSVNTLSAKALIDKILSRLSTI